MNKKGIIAIATLAFFASCSNTPKELPEKPEDQETYVDNHGNHWIWNAMMMRWAMSGTGGAGSYFYYPNTGTYTTPSGAAVDPPANVKNGINDGIKARSSSSKSVFGSTGKSHSVHA